VFLNGFHNGISFRNATPVHSLHTDTWARTNCTAKCMKTQTCRPSLSIVLIELHGTSQSEVTSTFHSVSAVCATVHMEKALLDSAFPEQRL
jgi:hypothetical protein